MTATVAIVTLPGFNELDSFLALHLLNRAEGVRAEGVRAFLAGPSAEAVSMNGVATAVSGSMADAADADAVLLGSSRKTRDFANDADFLASLEIDPTRQLIGSQCSGALILAKLGLLAGRPVCTDNKTRPWIEELGLEVLSQPLHVVGSIATAGGCLSSQYLATWVMLRLAGEMETRRALTSVVPIGEGSAYADTLVARACLSDPELLSDKAQEVAAQRP